MFAPQVDRRRTLSTLFAVVLVAASCSNSNSSTEPKNETAVDAGEGSIGECLRFDDVVGAQVEDLPVIACSEPHTHEIYAVEVADENDVYPGFDVLEDTARLACLTAFEGYVGRSAFDSSLFYSWLVPTLDSWNDSKVNDRTTLCVLGASDGSPLVGSMKGADI